jgi:hypothetical protein
MTQENNEQSKKKTSALKIVLVIIIGIFAINLTWIIGFGWVMKDFFTSWSNMFSTSDEFLQYQNQIHLSDLQMSWVHEDRGAYITTIGKIRNDSDLIWERVAIEVRYYDSSKQLIDTITDRPFDLILPAHSEVTFRVRGPAAHPKEDYASQEVKIIWAQKKHGAF